MQTMPPQFAPALPIVDRPQAVNEIRPPSEAGGSASNGEAGNPDARDAQLASDHARLVARLIGDRDIAEDQVLIPGLLALDTREVGDQDIIDPNRPTVRGPEPLGEFEPIKELPPLPDEVDPAETAEVTEARESAEALPGSGEADRSVDLPEIGTPDGADTARQPGQPQPMKAQPASPGAVAPDVPEPPEPGNVDIRR